MKNFKKRLPYLLFSAVVLVLTFLSFSLSRRLSDTLNIQVEGTFQYAELPLAGRNIALTDEGTYVYYSIIGDEPIQTSENSWTYEHEVFHAGWYTVDGRVVTLEDTEGNFHQAVYTQDTLYLFDSGEGLLELSRIQDNATYLGSNVKDAFPSPRT